MKLELTLPDKPGFLHMLPGLDIVALIIIFPLMGSSFMQQTGLDVETHESPWRFKQMDNPIVITLGTGPGNPIWVNKKQIPETELEAEVLRLRGTESGKLTNTAVLQVDKNVSSGREKTILNRLIKMGLHCALLGRPAGNQ